jgi:hypothetical protein
LEGFGATSAGQGGANTYHVNVHDNGLGGTQLGEWAPASSNIYTSYNSYGMMWTPSTITFYFNGQSVYQEATPSDMSAAMYMIATIAVGGSWPGQATGETGQMKIDYIRAFSSDSAIPAVALKTISSPDGGGTSLYGATASGGTTPPTPPTPPTTPTPTSSANYTAVLAGSSAAITDASGNAWTITSGGQIAVNGTVDSITSGVTQLVYVNSTIWQENTWKNWYGESKPNDSWSSATTTSPVAEAVAASQATVPVGFINGTVNATSGSHAFFITGSSDTLNLSGGTETITDSGKGGNTFNLPKAGGGSAIFNATTLTDGDVFGLKTALAATGWTGSTSTLSSFLHVVNVGATTELTVSAAAGGTGTLLATFNTSNVSLSTILAHATT